MNNYIILFAWKSGSQKGGMDDCCGTFASGGAAEDFFNHSTHCEEMDTYQLFDIMKREVIWEGKRGRN